MAVVKMSFENAVALLKIVNPIVELVTKWTGFLFKVVDRQIVAPSGFGNDDEKGESNDEGEHK